MKHSIFIRYIIVALVTLWGTSCADDLIKVVNNKQLIIAAEDFAYNISSRTSYEIGSEGVLFSWKKNDTIGIFPSEGSQVSFPMEKGAGSKLATFNGGGWALKQASSYAAYYPYRYTVSDPKKIEVSLNNQIQTGNGSTSHLGNYDFMVAKAVTPENGNVTFNFQHLCSLVEFTLNIPQKGDVASIRLTCSGNDIFTNSGFFDITSENPHFIASNKQNCIYLTLENIHTTTDNESVKAYLMMAPGDYSNESITLELINNGLEYRESINLGILEAGKAYRFNNTNQPVIESGNIIHIQKAGTLPSLIGEENKLKYSTLKLIGEINGTDIKFVREMCNSQVPYTEGLQTLDLYEANIVAGGDSYINSNDTRYLTEDNTIGYHMFHNLPSIKEIILPKGATTISKEVFSGSFNLETIEVSDNVTFIDSYAFDGCNSLRIVKLPSKLEYIGNNAFAGCPNIQAFYGPFTSDDNKCVIFNHKLIRYATASNEAIYSIPNNVTHIEEGAFCDSNLSTVNIPLSVTIIGARAFSNCRNLSTIEIPSSIQRIDDYAFGASGLTSVYIPSSVSALSHSAFRNCSRLESFTGKFASDDNRCLLMNNTLVAYAGGNKAKEYVVEFNIKQIGRYAFSSTCYLESLKISNPNIKVIEPEAFEGTSIKHIDLGDHVEALRSYAFAHNSSLLSIKLPRTLKLLESYCFAHCMRLESINIPNGIPHIPDGLLFDCQSLKTVTLPESIQSIAPMFVVQTGKFNILSSIHCYAKNPPSCSGDITNITDQNGTKIYCDIYVPTESVEKYKSTYPWSLYPIHPIEKPNQ